MGKTSMMVSIIFCELHNRFFRNIRLDPKMLNPNRKALLHALGDNSGTYHWQ